MEAIRSCLAGDMGGLPKAVGTMSDLSHVFVVDDISWFWMGISKIVRVETTAFSLPPFV